MLSLARITVLVLALWFAVEGQAVACIKFEQTRSGDAYLVNGCQMDINAAYGLTGGDDWAPGSSALVRVHVAAEERKLIWTSGNRPFDGKYKIKVFSCVAPTSLVYPVGGRPSCQISFADAG